MDAAIETDFARHFEQLPDPRQPHLVRHPLMSIWAIAAMAAITGCDGWQSVALWARCKEKWRRSFQDMPSAIAPHETLGRLFSRLNRPTLDLRKRGEIIEAAVRDKRSLAGWHPDYLSCPIST